MRDGVDLGAMCEFDIYAQLGHSRWGCYYQLFLSPTLVEEGLNYRFSVC